MLVLGLALAGCASSSAPTTRGTPKDEGMSFDQLGQTDFDRTVTVAMKQNLATLSALMEKLYKRNPVEWHKSHFPNLAAALAQGRQAIATGQVPPDLAGMRDIQVLSVALDPGYRGDRVRAFIEGLANMIIEAHGGRTRFYATDRLDAQHVYNAARNVETAAWMLATRRDASGRPLLLSNEMSVDGASNLSFERGFGELIGRLDLVASLLDENLRRIGINYVQGLLLFNFLPVR
ncbi:MAG TPA: hypothetical protein VFR20_03160 [Burkholderiaceae bacterium]|nr:hypothetical protein [Burkholderiaceae bacterium]